MWVETDPKRKHHTIVLGNEIKYKADFSLPQKELIMQNTLMLNQILETHIRKHVTQWAFLPVYHQNKIISKTTFFNQDQPVKNLIERLEFYHDFIKRSYEVGSKRQGTRAVHFIIRSSLLDVGYSIAST